MAEIDKSLPNVEQQLTLPSEQEVSEEALQEEQEIAEAGDPVEITENEDGSVESYNFVTKKFSLVEIDK